MKNIYSFLVTLLCLLIFLTPADVTAQSCTYPPFGAAGNTYTPTCSFAEITVSARTYTTFTLTAGIDLIATPAFLVTSL